MSAQNLVLRLQMAGSQRNQSPEVLRELATEYARLCAEANARLSDCIFFARKGFRSEAARLIEQPPNLLDEVGHLGFSNSAAWVATANALGIAVPDLAMNLAIELSEVLEKHQAHQALVNEYRLVNSMNRPKAELVKAADALCAAEPSNLTWSENRQRLADV